MKTLFKLSANELTNDDLARALGITVLELGLTEYYNQEIFDDGGVATHNKFIFSDNSFREILDKIEGLDKNKTITFKVESQLL